MSNLIAAGKSILSRRAIKRAERKTTKKSMRQFFKERDRAFLETDIDWARRNWPGGKPSSDRVVHAGFHKARLAALYIPFDLRLESANWLAQHGFKSVNGKPPHEELREGS